MVHFLQAGRVSSHLIFRFLQVKQPVDLTGMPHVAMARTHNGYGADLVRCYRFGKGVRGTQVR